MSQDLYAYWTSIQRFVGKHHAFMFTILVVLLLAAAVYVLYDVLSSSEVTTTAQSTIVTTFDEKTVETIRSFQSSTDTKSNLEFPSPRANPFSEK